jgi:hypothetical protein
MVRLLLFDAKASGRDFRRWYYLESLTRRGYPVAIRVVSGHRQPLASLPRYRGRSKALGLCPSGGAWPIASTRPRRRSGRRRPLSDGGADVICSPLAFQLMTKKEPYDR